MSLALQCTCRNTPIGTWIYIFKSKIKNALFFLGRIGRVSGMSHAVVRGEPYAAQLYLDTVLDEILLAKGIRPDAKERDKVTLVEVIFHSLKKHPNGINMVSILN